FALEQQLGHHDQGLAMLLDELLGPAVAVLHELFDLLVDADGGRFTVVAMLGDLTAEEDLLLLLAEADRPELAHAPLADHLARQPGPPLDILARASGYWVHKFLV